MKINTKAISKKLKKLSGKLSFDWLFNKKVLLILSVLLSITLWFLVTLNVSSDETKMFYNIPVKIDEEVLMSKGLKLVEIKGDGKITNRLVDVELSGNRYSLGQVNEDDISVVAQLSNIEENKKGEYKLQLKTVCSSLFSVSTTTNNTTYMNVYLDVMSTASYNVEATVSNCTAVNGVVDGVDYGDDYIVDVPVALLDGERVKSLTLEAPQDIMTKIASVQFSAEGKKNMTQSESFDGFVILRNASGEEMSSTDLKYVTVVKADTANSTLELDEPISELKVSVEVPIKRLLSMKVQPKVAKEKYGNGFVMPPIKCDPTVVTAKCLPTSSNYVSNGDIINNEINVDLNFAEDITLKNRNVKMFYSFPSDLEGSGEYAGAETVDISIACDLTGYSQTKMTIPVTAANIVWDDSLSMNVIPQDQSLSITIIGPHNEIKKLTNDRIEIFVRLDANAEPGAATTVPCNVYVKGLTHCWASGQYNVTVKTSNKE